MDKHWNAKNCWTDAEAALSSGLPVLLVGPPGTGKTRKATTHGLTKPPINITLTQGTPEAELRGHYMLSETGAWKWHHGPVVRAMVQGRRIVVNEIQRVSDEAMSFLLAALDMADPQRQAMLSLDLPNGESVQPIEGYQVVATSNVAATDLDPALRDRFAVVAELPTPEPSAFKNLGQYSEAASRHCIEAPTERKGSLRAWLAIKGLIERGVEQEVAFRLTMGEEAVALMMALKLGTKDPARS